MPDGTVKQRRGGFWKSGSYVIKEGDIDEPVKANPEVVVVGAGTSTKAHLALDV